jgi:hypothetical protein
VIRLCEHVVAWALITASVVIFTLGQVLGVLGVALVYIVLPSEWVAETLRKWSIQILRNSSE